MTAFEIPQRGEARPDFVQPRQGLREAELASVGLALNATQIRLLDAYASLVRRWSKMVGLVSQRDLAQFGARHLLDSLIAVKAVREIQEIWGGQPLRLVDLGSGAGLPGVPLSVALPEVSVALVERSVKKARFLSRVQRELDLANVRVHCKDFAHMPPACCHIITARALMPLPDLWKCAGFLLKPQGCLLAFDRIGRSQRALGEADAAPEGFPGGSILARHWERMAGVRDGFWASGLLVVRRNDSNHSGGQSEGRRWQNHDQR